jgi:hypothetical protein
MKNSKVEADRKSEMRQLDMEEKRILRFVKSPALAKSCMDPFDYACRLRTGEVVFFEGATIVNKEWITLTLKPQESQPKFDCLKYPGPRGIDVRISDIVWVMDAPNGS